MSSSSEVGKNFTKLGAKIPIHEVGNRDNDQVKQSLKCEFDFWSNQMVFCKTWSPTLWRGVIEIVVLLSFQIEKVFTSKQKVLQYLFRSPQTPNKSFMKLFGYISGANEVIHPILYSETHLFIPLVKLPLKSYQVIKCLQRTRQRFRWRYLCRPKWPL